MRGSQLIMLIVALSLGGSAAYLTKIWLENAVETTVVDERPTVNMRKVLVAAVPMKFGVEVSQQNVKEVEWPIDAVPEGVFTSFGELLKPGGKRLVLASIAANEPLLKWKITGPGQRASLSALLKDGLGAVTIRVNDVLGVAGFVLPGDRVDIMLTRQEGESRRKRAFTDMLLQNVRVLAIDQVADESLEKPVVSKAVTLAVNHRDAQKLVLAATVGRLSLSLRPSGSTKMHKSKRVSISDLGVASTAYVPSNQKKNEEPASEDKFVSELGRNTIVGVTRSIHRTEYSVKAEEVVIRGWNKTTTLHYPDE